MTKVYGRWRRLTNTEGNHNKVWEVAVFGGRLFVRHGKIGTRLTTEEIPAASWKANHAYAEAAERSDKKKRSGYAIKGVFVYTGTTSQKDHTWTGPPVPDQAGDPFHPPVREAAPSQAATAGPHKESAVDAAERRLAVKVHQAKVARIKGAQKPLAEAVPNLWF